MRIALDAMGGDCAPTEIVKGAVAAVKEQPGAEVLLVGRRAIIEEEMARSGARNSAVGIVEAEEVIGMQEHPASAVRAKPNSSIVVGINLVKDGQAAAFVSAGNSGAVAAAALLTLGKVKGIKRPALAAVLPLEAGPVLFLDAGANSDCKPLFLLQFAQMGTVYMQRVMGVPNPRIGLLSNGSEDSKGTHLVQAAHKLLRQSSLHFIGNIEGQEISKHAADVVVTDGFTGNIVVKVSEGFNDLVFDRVKAAASSAIHLGIAASILRPTFQSIAKTLDYTEHGGAPLLGVKGNVIIAHGRSEAKAIKNAVSAARRAIEQGLPGALEV